MITSPVDRSFQKTDDPLLLLYVWNHGVFVDLGPLYLGHGLLPRPLPSSPVEGETWCTPEGSRVTLRGYDNPCLIHSTTVPIPTRPPSSLPQTFRSTSVHVSVVCGVSLPRPFRPTLSLPWFFVKGV